MFYQSRSYVQDISLKCPQLLQHFAVFS